MLRLGEFDGGVRVTYLKCFVRAHPKVEADKEPSSRPNVGSVEKRFVGRRIPKQYDGIDKMVVPSRSAAFGEQLPPERRTLCRRNVRKEGETEKKTENSDKRRKPPLPALPTTNPRLLRCRQRARYMEAYCGDGGDAKDAEGDNAIEKEHAEKYFVSYVHEVVHG